MLHRKVIFAAVWLSLATLFLPGSVSRAASPARPSEVAQLAKAQSKAVKGYTLSPEKYRQAVAFNQAANGLYFLGFFYGVAIYLLVLRLRVAPKYRDWAERASSRRLVQAIVFVPLLLVTLRLLNLPRAVSYHWVLREFGLSVQSWGSWAWDWTKLQLLVVGFGVVLAWVFYGVIRQSPQRWWFYFWLAALPIMVFVVFLEPMVVEPLFYRFEPLANTHPDLVAQIEKVVERGGLRIPPEHMLEMKASVKRKAVSAYVTGIGASKRVVIWDTTLEKLNAPQTLAVFGHEMGHYVLRHIPKGMALAAVELLVFLFVGSRLLKVMLRRWTHHWGIRGLADWASLPAVLLLFSLFNFFATPIENSYSRRIEHEADIYALEVTHSIVPEAGEAAAESFQILGETNLEDPDPGAVIKFWRYSHPPLADRLRFALTYDPWSKGQTPRFVK